MITKKNPKEILLFSRFDSLLSPAAGKTLDRSWQGVFRRMVLHLLPVDKIEGKFSEDTRRPTKELYSVCGLILMMEYFGWTREEARMNYMVNLGIQYALNIEEDGVELSLHSLQRYIELLSKSETAQEASTGSFWITMARRK